MRSVEYWDAENEERLTHEDKDEAIKYILDGLKEWPKTMEICGYARMELPKVELLWDHVLDRFLEDLDEEYGNPYGDCTYATDGMKEAAKVFVTAVLDEYKSWACEIVERETIDVMAWVKVHRPDWLGGEEKDD